ncbi:hypothetical protein C8F04DRAFT_1173628 [Mycena alexandri]|uniref:DUF6699 domain-containing protein n=1 Tax=Mycena alexandri TaxID=1745969 RepID=A0AAD6TGA0_9AGAR|nr:hypothetical protein C8F04DRAFT_1173628 [Mycena alexandri]
MSQSSKMPPTPKLGSVSLPDDNDNTKIFGGSRKRLSSFLGKAGIKTTPKIGVSRSMTPVPVPVTRYEYPQLGGYSRPRASSMTSRPPIPCRKHGTSQRRVLQGLPISRLSFSPLAYMSHSAARASGVVVRPPPGKHEGPDTPKYMKAKVKEVALKEESVVLSWPLVPFSDRRHSKYPLLYYDVAFDPQDKGNIRDNRQTHFLALPQEDQELPVSTHCKMTEMVIHCPHVGSLVVERPEGLRCIDVFYAIYCKYQKKPRSHEMPENEAKYQAAFKQRCRDCPGLPEFNRRAGFLRVDLLRGKRIFDGLRRSNGRWELVFDEPGR